MTGSVLWSYVAAYGGLIDCCLMQGQQADLMAATSHPTCLSPTAKLQLHARLSSWR
jgi:hypothetical protein